MASSRVSDAMGSEARARSRSRSPRAELGHDAAGRAVSAAYAAIRDEAAAPCAASGALRDLLAEAAKLGSAVGGGDEMHFSAEGVAVKI